jgi:predicted nuclease of predicted toxin-antitoxin system
VTCVADVGLMGATDEDQLKFATRSGRVLVTQDADFLRLHKTGTVRHSGIIYCDQGSRGVLENRGASCSAMPSGNMWRGTPPTK